MLETVEQEMKTTDIEKTPTDFLSPTKTQHFEYYKWEVNTPSLAASRSLVLLSALSRYEKLGLNCKIPVRGVT